MRARLAIACLIGLFRCGGTGPRSPALVEFDAGGPAATPAPYDAGSSATAPADAGTPPAAPPLPADAGMAAEPPLPSLGGCPMFPRTSPWNIDISNEPVDPHSADYLA